MDEEQSISFSHIFYSIMVFFFAFGSIWVARKGVEIYSANLDLGKSVQKANVSETISLGTSTEEVTVTSKQEIKRLKVLVGGDVMLDRGVRLLGQKYGYDSLFASTSFLFKQADIVAVNLEGPITSNKSKTLLPNGKTGKELTFTFDPKTAQVLKNAGITVVSLANNHADNFGRSGFNETKKWLSEADLQWFGDPANSTSTQAIISKNDMNIAFVGYHAFRKGFEGILADIKSLTDQGAFVIVMPHWSEEYATSSSAKVRAQARELVLAGAKAVIGAHPHVVLERAMIGDVPVFYSIGNLLFDQHFSPEVMAGQLVELNLMKEGERVSIESIKIYETSLSSRKGVSINPKPVDF